MLSSIKIIVISSALISPQYKVEPKPIYINGDYSIEAAEYLRKKDTSSDTITDIMYREILKELESNHKN